MKLEFHKENNSSIHRLGSLREAKMGSTVFRFEFKLTLYFEVSQSDDQNCSVFQLTTGSMLLMISSSMRLW